MAASACGRRDPLGRSEALVAFATAAAAWGVPGVRGKNVELWVPDDCRKRAPGVVVHRGTRLDRADRTVLDGLRLTSPTRTLIDCSGRLEDDALLAAMEELIRRRLVSPTQLAARLVALRTSGRPGAGRLEALLDSRPVDASALESRLEAKVWRVLVQSDLPPCERQRWIVANGRRYRLDFAWSDQRVAVECDGWAVHSARARFEADELRRADLASVGYLVVPVTWVQSVSSPDDFVARVRAALARRSGFTGP